MIKQPICPGIVRNGKFVFSVNTLNKGYFSDRPNAVHFASLVYEESQTVWAEMFPSAGNSDICLVLDIITGCYFVRFDLAGK